MRSMDRSSIQKYCFLFVFCYLTCLCTTDAAEDEKQVYIVYMGAIPEEHRSPQFSNKLQEHHLQMLQEVADESFSSYALVRSYKRSFNGFAANLTKQEQEKLASNDRVVSVFPSRTHWPQTTSSWDYMGLHENVNGNASKGSDIIIGVLDSGIWPESESFGDKGFGPIPKKWKGVCMGGRNFICNKKLIGARFYTSNEPAPDSARDFTGHGTHTASIAAGNPVKDASFYGIARGTARGGAPSARIAAYKVCYEDMGCDDTEILAAFDDAIADGVDIISISVSSYKPFDIDADGIAIGSLHAMLKGILTVQSVGNIGFAPGTVSSVAPWLLSVGASSMDRGIVTKITLGNGKTMVGKSVNSFKLKRKKYPLVYGKAVTKHCDEMRARDCSPGCLERRRVRGKIVVCDSTEGIKVALEAGAIGTIARLPDEEPDASFIVPLPASLFLDDDLKLVQNYANSTRLASAFISASKSFKDIDAPLVASFSSKGPNTIVPDILKPDIIAPGVEILAANSPFSSASGHPADKRSVKYKILSGTSMASPHAAGAAVLVKLAHPDWSPSAIKSALMTTASIMDPKKHKDAEFSYGSGHLNPVNATNAGLVYETDNNDYIKTMCKLYGLETARSLFKNNSIKCSKLNRLWGISKNLNYPSMSLKVKEGARISATFTRTVTNVGIANSTYTATIMDKALKLSITVEPRTLSFKQLNEKKSFVVSVKGSTMRSMISASLMWSDGTHSVRSPIVVY